MLKEWEKDLIKRCIKSRGLKIKDYYNKKIIKYFKMDIYLIKIEKPKGYYKLWRYKDYYYLLEKMEGIEC